MLGYLVAILLTVLIVHEFFLPYMRWKYLLWRAQVVCRRIRTKTNDEELQKIMRQIEVDAKDASNSDTL